VFAVPAGFDALAFSAAPLPTGGTVYHFAWFFVLVLCLFDIDPIEVFCTAVAWHGVRFVGLVVFYSLQAAP